MCAYACLWKVPIHVLLITTIMWCIFNTKRIRYTAFCVWRSHRMLFHRCATCDFRSNWPRLWNLAWNSHWNLRLFFKVYWISLLWYHCYDIATSNLNSVENYSRQSEIFISIYVFVIPSLSSGLKSDVNCVEENEFEPNCISFD